MSDEAIQAAVALLEAAGWECVPPEPEMTAKQASALNARIKAAMTSPQALAQIARTNALLQSLVSGKDER